MNGPVKAMLALAILAGSVGAGLADETRELTLSEVQRRIRERGYSWTAGHTSVSDLSAAARRDLAGLVMPLDAEHLEASIPLLEAPADVVLPERWDWRESVPGVHPVGVTPVKNQGTCSSCWAFAAAAQLESHIRIAGGVVEDLSEQQLVSCNHGGGSCRGGWHLDAYTVFMAPGAVGEICFPYESANAPCAHWDCPAVAGIASYSRVANTIPSIKHALMTGPLFVGIRWQEMFAFYKSGVFDIPADDDLRLPISNHAVILVGWDDTLEHASGTGAWIVKNSWGAEWGMEGYAYVSYASTFLDSGPRQLTYRPDSSSRLVLDEPQNGQTWIAGTNQTVSWITDLAADRFEVGYLIGGQYQVVDAAIPDSATHFEFNAPDVRADDLVVRVTALADDGAVLATAESASPIYLAFQRVLWPGDGVVVGTGSRPHALVPDGAGGCIIVWAGVVENFVTRLSAEGVSVWSGPRSLPGGIHAFSAVSDESGGAYLAYSVSAGGNHHVRIIRVTADGALPWGTSGLRVDHLGGEFGVGHSVSPLLAADGDGGVICAWSFYSASFGSVYGQRITADGVELWDAGDAPGRRLTVRPGAGICAMTRIEGDAVAVAYICFGDGTFDRTDLWVQQLEDTGARPWGEEGRRVRAGEGATADQSLASDLYGGVAVVWRESGVGWSRAQFQRFSAAGVATWQTGGMLVDRMEVAGRLHPRLVADENGGHLVSIAKQSSLCELDVSVYRFGPDGGHVWQPGGVPVLHRAGLLGYLGVDAPLVADGAGGAIVFWVDLDADVSGGRVGVIAQHVAADGTLGWTPFGEPVVLSHEVEIGDPVVCRDRAGHLSLTWCYEFADPTVHFQRVAGIFPAPPRCEVTASLRREGELQALAGNVVRGCPGGDADALVIVCDFEDADLAGVSVVSPTDIGLDTSALGISLGSVTAADIAGTPDNGFCVTLVRDRVLGCSGDAAADGPLVVTYRGVPIGTVPGVAVHGFDVSGDGAVNLVEIVGLAGTIGRQVGDPDFDACYDTTGDERVNLSDWSLLVGHYREPADAAPAAMVSLRRVGADEAQIHEIVVPGVDVQSAALRIEVRGAPASVLEWRADSPSSSGGVMLPSAGDKNEVWLVLPRLVHAKGPETKLGRLILPGLSIPRDARVELRVVGGEAKAADGRILALVGSAPSTAIFGASELAAPYPNPCNPSTTITFTAPHAGRLGLQIYDVTGRLVRTLVDEIVSGSAESRRVVWVGRDDGDRPVASGVYFVRMTAGEEVTTRRLVMIR